LPAIDLRAVDRVGADAGERTRAPANSRVLM
jgi:hypothetical protein